MKLDKIEQAAYNRFACEVCDNAMLINDGETWYCKINDIFLTATETGVKPVCRRNNFILAWVPFAANLETVAAMLEMVEEEGITDNEKA